VRRSPAQLQKLADQLVAVVKAHPRGINAEDIKTKMGIKHGNVGAKVFTKPLGVALASKKIRKSGSVEVRNISLADSHKRRSSRLDEEAGQRCSS
jgi:hypothetical protein